MNLLFKHSGKVFSIKDAIAQVIGLNKVTSGEMVQERGGYMGLVLNLEVTYTGIVMFEDNIVMSGDYLNRTFNTLSIFIDFDIMGSVLTPLGKMLTKTGSFCKFNFKSILNLFGQILRGVELKAPGIIFRQPVYETVLTGVVCIDAVFPIGFGQRELIIGDRQTGKTSIAVDTFLNQANLDCIIFKSFISTTNLTIDSMQ